MYGSVRGARGNSRPYRDEFLLRCMSPYYQADFTTVFSQLRVEARMKHQSVTGKLPTDETPQRKAARDHVRAVRLFGFRWPALDGTTA
jgi:hypothetical protein